MKSLEQIEPTDFNGSSNFSRPIHGAKCSTFSLQIQQFECYGSLSRQEPHSASFRVCLSVARFQDRPANLCAEKKENRIIRDPQIVVKRFCLPVLPLGRTS